MSSALPYMLAQVSSGVAAKIQDRVRRDYEEHLAVLEACSAEQPDDSVAQRDSQYTALRQALIGRKHEAVIELRDEGVMTTSCCARCKRSSTSRTSA